MGDVLTACLEDLRALMEQVQNPRIACEHQVVRTLTLQFSDASSSDGSSWSCDASIECGYGNEHFCRFAPITVDATAISAIDAVTVCRDELARMVAERPELLFEDV